MCRREAGDRNAIGRAADVIEACAVAELDAAWVATMLAADAELQVGLGLPTACRGDFDQRTDTLAVDRLERISRQDAFLDIKREEAAGIVTAHAERRLRQV